MRPMIAPSTAINSTKVMTAIASRASCESFRDTNTATITIKGTQAIESLNRARGARDVREREHQRHTEDGHRERALHLAVAEHGDRDQRDDDHDQQHAVAVGPIEPFAEGRPFVPGAPLLTEVDRRLLVLARRAIRPFASLLGSLLIHG